MGEFDLKMQRVCQEVTTARDITVTVQRLLP